MLCVSMSPGAPAVPVPDSSSEKRRRAAIMALNITNPVVVSKVERLARATGLSKTAAVERAFDQLLRETVGADNGSAGVMASLAQLDRFSSPATLEDLKLLLRSLNEHGGTFDTLSRYAQTIDLDGIAVKTVDLEGLLLTKQTMRDKDVADRIIIERAIEALKARTRHPD